MTARLSAGTCADGAAEEGARRRPAGAERRPSTGGGSEHLLCPSHPNQAIPGYIRTFGAARTYLADASLHARNEGITSMNQTPD
jgi:hypothetical protein